MRRHRRDVRVVGAHRKQAAMHRRMQCLDAAIHHLRKASELRHVAHHKPGLGERLARAASRDEFDSVTRERAGKLDQSGLIGHGEKGAGDGAQVFGHGAQTSRHTPRRRGIQ